MASEEFWLSLLSNFVANILAGVLLGSFATILITRFLQNEEKKLHELEKKVRRY